MTVPAGSCEKQDFVGIKGLPLHQKGHIWHLLIVQEVRIWKTDSQKNLMFLWLSQKHMGVQLSLTSQYTLLYMYIRLPLQYTIHYIFEH